MNDWCLCGPDHAPDDVAAQWTRACAGDTFFALSIVVHVDRPRALVWVVALLFACNVVAAGVTYAAWPWDTSMRVPASGAVLGVGCGVTWCLWRGRNWARWCVVATSAAMLAPFVLLNVPRMTLSVDVAVAALGAGLLYWLTSRPVKRYYRAKSRDPIDQGAPPWAFMAVGAMAGLAIAVGGFTMYFQWTSGPTSDESLPLEYRERLTTVDSAAWLPPPASPPTDQLAPSADEERLVAAMQSGVLWIESVQVRGEDGRVALIRPGGYLINSVDAGHVEFQVDRSADLRCNDDEGGHDPLSPLLRAPVIEFFNGDGTPRFTPLQTPGC